MEESSQKTPRIKDVARKAGVSTATVSHVINKTKYVTDRTRASVLKAIEECNYYPNAQARSLASGRTGTRTSSTWLVQAGSTQQMFDAIYRQRLSPQTI